MGSITVPDRASQRQKKPSVTLSFNRLLPESVLSRQRRQSSRFELVKADRCCSLETRNSVLRTGAILAGSAKGAGGYPSNFLPARNGNSTSSGQGMVCSDPVQKPALATSSTLPVMPCLISQLCSLTQHRARCCSHSAHRSSLSICRMLRSRVEALWVSRHRWLRTLSVVCRQKAQACEISALAHHDLRRTCARLCHPAGGELVQIKFPLGHISVQTTERCLGCKQRSATRPTIELAWNQTGRDLSRSHTAGRLWVINAALIVARNRIAEN
jgi:hypothetical protein